MQASGLIQRVEAGEGLARRVTATVNTELFGIDLGDPALSEAAGASAKANVVMEWQEGNPIRIGFLDFTSGDLSIVGSGTVDGVDANLRVAGDVALRTGSLDRFAALAKRPIDGSAEIGLIGWYEPLGGAFEAAIEGTTVALELGPTPLFDLVEGASTFNLDVKRDTGGIAIKTLALRAPGVTVELDGLLKTQASDLRASVSINDVSQVVAGISGPGNLGGTVRQSGPEWIVDFNGSGPGGSVFTATGTVAETFDTVDLEVKAAVPIGLANTFISAPIDIQGMANIDLAIRGAPSIDAVSGTISTTDTRIAAPAFSVTLRNVDATASIAGGLANLTMTGNFAGGGRMAVDGRIGLTPGYVADMQINLINAEFSDAQSYTANANGNLTLQGPLQGGASISGRIDVDEAEIRLAPPTTVVGIPDITHLNEAAAVARTRQRAGLQQTGETGDTAASAPLGLDVVISAPSRIFIRGRGLDTELGGRLRITGTTQDVIPIGQFSLVRGRLDILGKRLDMVEGQLLLQGSLNPRFRMVASTATTNATVRIITEGTAQAPSFTFESDPDLPDDEILANLLFGRSIATISPLQAAQLATAVATLTGSGGGGLFDRIREQFNLDDLDVTTDDNGAAALRLGKYLNENVYTDFSFSSDGTSQINLNLDVTPNVVAKGSASSDGATGLGIFFEKDY